MTGYTDSRGAEMEPMSWSEALKTVLELAEDNQLSEEQAEGDDALEEVRAWQDTAIETMTSLLDERADEIDGFEMPTASGDWDDAVWSAERSMDPVLPANAIRICYDLGWENALDPREAGRDPELAEEVDRQQQAFDLARDFLGMHSAKLTGTTAKFDL